MALLSLAAIVRQKARRMDEQTVGGSELEDIIENLKQLFQRPKWQAIIAKIQEEE
jgi:hypothetical protein